MPQKRRQKRSTWSRASVYIIGHELLLACLVAAAVIAVGLAFGWENNKIVPASSNALAHYTQEPHNRLSFLSEWDGPDYLQIAEKGYTASIQTNFFPLYPLVIRIVQAVVRSPLNSALLVSWASLVGAIYYYLRIIKERYALRDNLEAVRASLFFVLFPTGVFLFAVYTESLFSLLSLGALYYALQKRWLPAALLVGLATATHITGLFVLVLVALVLLEHKERLRNILAGVIIGCLGIAAYMVYLQIHFHDALAFVASQKSRGWLYGHGVSGLISHLVTRNLIFLALLLAAAAYWWRRQRSYAVYAFLYVCIVLLGGLGAFGRYALTAFPIPFMLYDYLRTKKMGYIAVIIVSAIFWTYFLLQYVAGYTTG